MKMSGSEDMYNNWACDPCVSRLYKNLFETEQMINTWIVLYDAPMLSLDYH